MTWSGSELSPSVSARGPLEEDEAAFAASASSTWSIRLPTGTPHARQGQRRQPNCSSIACAV